jgi:hypothetical protein
VAFGWRLSASQKSKASARSAHGQCRPLVRRGRRGLAQREAQPVLDQRGERDPTLRRFAPRLLVERFVQPCRRAHMSKHA